MLYPKIPAVPSLNIDPREMKTRVHKNTYQIIHGNFSHNSPKLKIDFRVHQWDSESVVGGIVIQWNTFSNKKEQATDTLQ